MLAANEGFVPPDDEAVLVLISHSTLLERPTRTREVLEVFLMREAEAAFRALCCGEAPVVQRGLRPNIELLAAALEAQGFLLSVRRVDAHA